eukprot:scaffold18509_cov158-Skeletonema_menzelii.AAC.6
MSGWDDEDDLDEMLFNDDEYEGAALNNNNNNNNGWDDDDGLLDDLDDFSSQGEKDENSNNAPKVQQQQVAVDAEEEVAVGTTATISLGSEAKSRVVTMLTEHEKMMLNEINDIQTTDRKVTSTIIEGQVATATAREEEENDDAWDFEDDEDIFNENNNDLDETTTASIGATTTPMTAAPEDTQFSSSIVNDGGNYQSNPPPPTEKNEFSVTEMKSNPFLQDSDDEGQSPLEGQNVTALMNNDNEKKMDNALISNNEEDGGGDGWSDDDDFFDDEDEEELNSSLSLFPVEKMAAVAAVTSTMEIVPPPPPPPPPVPTTAASTSALHDVSPVANRTRSKINTPGPPPPLLKPLQQQQPAALNPSQQRIHQMLSTYTLNLTNKDYPSRLHYKLHMYQTKSRTTTNNNNINGTTNNNGTTTNNTPASELRHYYAIRPKLRKYTLGVELDRMDYTLLLENGTCTSDKDVIRSYFGVGEDGGTMMGGDEEEDMMVGEEATVEELLIRSANQSLLADALVALTGSEEDVLVNGQDDDDDDFFNGDGEEKGSMGLILSGPTLCMSSVAESCHFTVDLQCGKVEALCDLAISVPFHGDVSTIQELLGDDDEQVVMTNIIGDGRIILARARVSVRFRPGGEGGNDNDEPTVQYAIQSVNPLLSANSPVLRYVAIALAHDQEDPFFQEEQRADVGDATDIRDLFLLNQHLLSDSGLLAVSDHLERLRGAAEAKSTGFRSALRQLDGVTNVTGKLQFLKGTANAARGQGSGSGSSGFLGLGLALPSAEEIEAAEREAQGAVSRQDNASFRFPRPDEVHEGSRFPRPDDVNRVHSKPHDEHNARPSPPPPPPPPAPSGMLPQKDTAIARPKPIIGGLLSRLAAAAAQAQPSDMRPEQEWGEGGTGLTPPSSPKANRFVQAPTTTNDFPTLYRKEENAQIISQSTEGVGVGFAQQPQQQQGDHGEEFLFKEEVSDDAMMENMAEDDGGWSDDEFDFEEPGSKDFVENEDVANEEELKATSLPPSSSHVGEVEALVHLQQGIISSVCPLEAKANIEETIQAKSSKLFSEELSIAMQRKIESENKVMLQSGRLKRWTPLREDRILRLQLMEVMRQNLMQN